MWEGDLELVDICLVHVCMNSKMMKVGALDIITYVNTEKSCATNSEHWSNDLFLFPDRFPHTLQRFWIVSVWWMIHWAYVVGYGRAAHIIHKIQMRTVLWKTKWQVSNGTFEYFYVSILWWCILTLVENCWASVSSTWSNPSPSTKEYWSKKMSRVYRKCKPNAWPQTAVYLDTLY